MRFEVIPRYLQQIKLFNVHYMTLSNCITTGASRSILCIFNYLYYKLLTEDEAPVVLP